MSCPREVDATASADAPIAEVVRAAQQDLSRQTIDSQGTIYHLTPRHAPIQFVAQLALAGAPLLDDRVPGLLPLHRAAAAACGEATARASWAIHYDIQVSVIVGAGGYVFASKTRNGWRFWGNWCGAGKSPSWRRKSLCG